VPSLASAAKPLVPSPPRLFDKQKQTSKVAADAEVVEVTLDAPRERGVLSTAPRWQFIVFGPFRILALWFKPLWRLGPFPRKHHRNT
jgi:hypothetical protein